MESQQYPVSLHGIQCVDDCKKKGTKVKHPITTTIITNTKDNFCPIQPTMIDGKIREMDICNINDNDIIGIDNDKSDPFTRMTVKTNEILYPIMPFNSLSFLKTYYDIKNVNDFYQWIKDNKFVPIFTKIRLYSCFITAFYHNVTILDDAFIDGIIDIIKKFMIKKIYKKICGYVGIIDNRVAIIKPSENKLNCKDDIDKRTKFIINDILTHQNIARVSTVYFNTEGKNDTYLEDYIGFIFNTIINDIIKNNDK
jgi:hypothetical protein